MSTLRAIVRLSVLAVVCWLPLAATTSADPVEDFYKGKTVTIVVGGPAGGIYDLYARALGRNMGRYIPGKPTVIVQNMPSSGATSSTNHVYNGAPQDGTMIGAPTGTTPFQPLFGIPQATFDPTKMLWLGSPTSDIAILLVWHTSTINSFEDTKTRPVPLGSNGPNGNSGFYAKVINDVFKTKLKSIYGYGGLAESFLAMERGEVEGYASIFWNQFKTSYADLIRDKKVKLLLQYGAKPHPDLPGLPFATDLVTVKEDRELFEASLAPLSIGYPLVMGPQVPADRGAAMVKAVAEIFRDKDFLEETAKLNLTVSPISSPAMNATIAKTYGLSPELKTRLRTLYNAQ